LLAFYGDDLTGSTDALEFICTAGAKTVLFLAPPTLEQLSRYPGLQAFGIAGLTRSLSPAQMEDQLLPAFQLMKQTGAKHVHYKVCSTFDSSPGVGSIGRAIDCGAQVFHNDFIPVLGGMPALGRYCVFGNLFARMGIGTNGKVYRLDRHPSMSKHPVTPANESDLRYHLGMQTKKKIALIDVMEMEKDIEEWNKVIGKDDHVVLLDAMSNHQLERIGSWLEIQCKNEEPLFSVGSSGIELALGNCWNSKGIISKARSWPAMSTASPMLVVSGSCSPVTAGQIQYAKANGFKEVILEAASISEDLQAVIEHAVKLLQNGEDVIVHTGIKRSETLSSEDLGKALGALAMEAVQQANVKRVIISGGDTSSYAGRAMEIEALEMIAPLVSGAPLCIVHSKNKNINGIEVNLKGGQVGAEDYFLHAKWPGKKMNAM
jgi:uncharacterized protein YgbK (DUF1537 family)